MKTKEHYIEEYINYLYGDIEEEDRPSYQPEITQSRADFKSGWNSCLKHLNNFEEGEEVEVTDPYHYKTNSWFKRKFIQKDSDGKFACRQIDGSVCRWDYIRKVIQ